MEKIKPVLDWIKGHLLITAMSVLIIAFLACGWYYSGVLNSELSSEVQARKKEFSKIDTAAKTSVSLPLLAYGCPVAGCQKDLSGEVLAGWVLFPTSTIGSTLLVQIRADIFGGLGGVLGAFWGILGPLGVSWGI